MLAIFYRLLAVSAVSALSWSLYQIALICRHGAVLARQFRSPPPRNKLLGHVEEMTTPDAHKTALRYVKEYGANVRMRLAWHHVIVVTEPALVSEILHHPDMDKTPDVYSAINSMMGSSGHPDLVTGPTDEWWRLVRKGVAAAFSPANIRDGFKYSAACGDKLVEVLRAMGPETSVDVDRACLSETMDMIGLFGFRHEFNAISKFAEGQLAPIMEVIRRGGLEVERRMGNPLRKFTAILTEEGRTEGSFFSQYHQITRELLDELKARGPPAEDDESLGAHLLRIRDADDRPLPDERLLPHIGMIFFAGMDTTGHTMSWTLFFISQHPEVEARIAEELQALGLLSTPEQPRPRVLEHADLGKLTYLSCAVKEAMRMKPAVASGTMRTPSRDVMLGSEKFHIPGGTGLWMPSYAMHNSELNWGPDTDVYRPERWLEPGVEYVQQSVDGSAAGNSPADAGSVKSDHRQNYELGINRDFAVRQPDAAHIKRYIPFSDGRRDCVGQALARMNYTSTLARLLGNFRFELAPESGGAAAIVAEETLAMTLQPGPKGILMRCTPRSASA